MPRVRTLTPGASPMHFFGSEVRRAREAAGLPQAELGALVPCDKSVVSRIEAGLVQPDEAFARACDVAFGASRATPAPTAAAASRRPTWEAASWYGTRPTAAAWS